MRKVLMLAIAAMALAIPASASAEIKFDPVFTHEGTPITSGSKTVVFSGPAAFAVTGTNQGVHCTNVRADIHLEKDGTGTVTSFTTEESGATRCTTTPDNFVAHTTTNGLPWTIHTDGHDNIRITGVKILNKVTHPITTHLVVAERELTGEFDATIPGGETEEIHNLSLSGSGTVDLFPGTANATVSGNLTLTTDTQVGTATVETKINTP